MLIKILSLLKYWRYGVAVAATVAVCYAVFSLRVGWINSAHEAEIAATVQDLKQQCADIQKHNNEVTNDYQQKLKVIDSRHADAIGRLLAHEARMCQSRCSGQPDATPTEGLSSEVRGGLITDLATCDKQAEQLEALQEWVK